MGDGRKGSGATKLPPIMGGITAMVEGATRNALTWGELIGLGNLGKCERSMFIGRNSPDGNFLTTTALGVFLF